MTVLLLIGIFLLSGYGVYAVRQRFETMARLAFEHGVRVNELATCDVPKPQLIYFKDPNKVYLPRATLIHRCSDLTGCCPHSTQTCAALETKTVDLYFYTISLKANNMSPRKVTQMQNIDRITLTNHTKCGCRFGSTDSFANNIIADSTGNSLHSDQFTNIRIYHSINESTNNYSNSLF